jgi:hypothetical protein
MTTPLEKAIDAFITTIKVRVERNGHTFRTLYYDRDDTVTPAIKVFYEDSEESFTHKFKSETLIGWINKTDERVYYDDLRFVLGSVYDQSIINEDGTLRRNSNDDCSTQEDCD